MTIRPLYISSCVAALVAISFPAYSQIRPDAGQTQQELLSVPSLPSRSDAPAITNQVGTVDHQSGGPQIVLKDIAFTGNSVFTSEQLSSVVSDARGGSFDLAGLKALADKVSAYYHAHDYPFARALIPAQSMSDGALTISVIEGRYGAVTVLGNDTREESAQGFADALHRGILIEGKELERVSLIMDDQPGYKFTPIIRPGQDIGTGDLTFNMTRDKRVGGSISADNYGNRYTGRGRAGVSLYANSPFMYGDQATLNTIYTEEDLWYGSAGYSLPIGYSGLRGNIGYAHTQYELGKEFSALDAHGTAKIASAGLSYPLIRSQDVNLFLSLTYQHKWLTDELGLAGIDDKKSSDVFPLMLGFDARDGFMGGGITYGALSWTHGVLNLDNALQATDSVTARTNGSFNKANLDVARLQSTPIEKLSLFGRFSGQLATDNLDSSEDFGLGGPNGVRAFPTGESYGDEGWLTQTELRYTTNVVTPYVFFDYGQSKTNHDSFAPGDNVRSIGGGGIGVRATYHNWDANLSSAWRTVGGDPRSDSRDIVPMVWASIGYKF